MSEMNLLNTELKKVNIHLNDAQKNQLITYMYAVLRENTQMNLTAITNKNEFIIKHIIDSLVMLDAKYIFDGIQVIDIGTGAGFPGIPLKILYPNIHLTLLDSVEKKLKFISRGIDALGINVHMIHERAENLGKEKDHREKYDIVVSKAVANIQVLSELCLPLVKVGGIMVTSKGPKYHEEMMSANKAIITLGGDLDQIDLRKIDFGGIERYIIIINKKNFTPIRYPRKPGIPNKNP
ncbi:MAG: 16S rRNA (guanine(527)-N(7))-methyltransferase RsmG, partial [Eubacteriales bacterium]